MRDVWGSGYVALVCLLLVGCHQRDRFGDTPAGPGPLEAGRIRIVSGADLTPVSDALVTLDSRPYRSDLAGYVVADLPTTPVFVTPADVEAPGFLTRRTSVRAGDTVTLWPVADEAEAAAIRAMVYERPAPFGPTLMPLSDGPLFVALLDQVGVQYDPWAVEAVSLGQAIGLPIRIEEQFQYEPNEIIVSVVAATTCRPAPTSGFCLVASPYKRFEVHASVANEPKTIRRVLASAFLGPNPLPGLMHAEAPADNLTPFELQTIKMIRQRPRPNRWPDTDR